MSFDATQNELESLFSQVGVVSEVFVPTDRATGRPRGFAFVQFEDADQAAEAIKRFDGYELRGRNLRVNEAEERPRRSFAPRDGGGGSGGGFGGGFDAPPKRNKPKGSRRNIRSRKRGF
jgi:RNA recognition motif-containing protein